MTARVKFSVSSSQLKAFRALATSDAIGDKLEALGDPVLAAARNDPNPRYVASLRMRRHISEGRLPRISIRIGATPLFGGKVEAKRGTLARALTSAGL